MRPGVRLEYIHRDGQYSDMEGVTNLQLNGQSPNSIAAIAAAIAAGKGPPGPQFHNSGSNEFPYRSPDHDLLNLRAGVEWGAWSITGFVQNLTDENTIRAPRRTLASVVFDCDPTRLLLAVR